MEQLMTKFDFSGMSVPEALRVIYPHCNGPSLTRMTKIVVATTGHQPMNQTIAKIFVSEGWPIVKNPEPREGALKEYPDAWSFFMEARTQFSKYRAVHGEEKAIALSQAVERCRSTGATDIWEWREELLAATAFPSREIVAPESLDPTIAESLRPHYDNYLVASMIEFAINRQFILRPEGQHCSEGRVAVLDA